MECVTIKNTSDAIRAAGNALRSGSDWTEAFVGLTSDSINVIKNRIIEFIRNFEAENKISIKDIKNFDVRIRKAFASAWNKEQQSLLNEFKDKLPNKYAEVDKTVNDIKLEFTSKDPDGYDRVNRKFKKNIADCAIFHIEYNDDGSIASITSVLSGSQANQDLQLNKRIHAYKLRLLEDIGAYTGIEINYDFYLNDAVFTDMIVNALSLFEEKFNKSFDPSSKIDVAAHDAYVTLKYFDTFLKDSQIIDIKDAYKNSATYAPEMYTYIGPKSTLSKPWGDDKILDASTVNSPIIKLIFDNMPVLNAQNRLEQDIENIQNTVETSFFMHAMQIFKSWLYYKEQTDALSKLDTDELLALFKQFVNFQEKGQIDSSLQQFRITQLSKLRGLKAVLDSNLDKKTLESIWQHLVTNEKMQYDMYSYKSGKWHRLEGTQKLISRQELRILDKIQDAVFRFGNNPEMFSEFCNNYNIKFGKTNGQWAVYIGVDNIEQPNEWGIRLRLNSQDKIDLEYYRSGTWRSTHKTIEIGRGENKQVLEGLSDKQLSEFNDNIKPLIENLLGMVPNNWMQHTATNNLLDIFAQAVGTTLLAINSKSSSIFNFNTVGESKTKILSTNSKHFKNKLNSLAQMFASAYKSDITITLTNLNGDGIPAFSLTSWIHSFKRTRNKLAQEAREKEVLNTFQYNFVYQNYSKIGQPFVRRDILMDDINKQAVNLSENEVMYLGLVCDFFESLFDDDCKDIHFQSTTNSDKATHWIIPYGKDILIYTKNGEQIKLSDALKSIVRSDEDSKKCIDAFMNVMYDCRRGQYMNICKNLINDFNEVFRFSLDTDDESVFDSIVKIRDFINNFKSDKYSQWRQYTNKNGESREYNSIEEAFIINNVQFYNELHVTKNGTFNNSLFDEIRLYCTDSDNLFKSRLNKQLNYFVNDLIENGFELNILDDRNLQKLISELPNKGKDWIDYKTGNIKLISDSGKINPLLISYFLSDDLLSTEFNKITDGFYWAHDGKYKPKAENGDFVKYTSNPEKGLENSDGNDNEKLLGINGEKVEKRNGKFFVYDKEAQVYVPFSEKDLQLSDDFYAHDAAKRLFASYKRTVINGANIELYSPKKYGISDRFTYALVKDMPATVWNMMGLQNTKLDSMDGSSLVHPVFATLCGWSSPSGKVTYDNKTICGDIFAKFGIPFMMKHAEFGLTNQRRQMGYTSDSSVEHLYQMMSSKQLPRFVKLEDYYGYRRKSTNNQKYGRDDFQRLYKKDPFSITETGDTRYYLISNLQTKEYQVQNENGEYVPRYICEYLLTEVDKNGIEIGAPTQETKVINNLYDIDQVFGGAFCMKLGENGLEDYDGNIGILANIVCEEDLKDYFVAYTINNSANKVGNSNTNGTEIFKSDFGITPDGNFDYSLLRTAEASTYNLGKQMNPDHELEFAQVSEMSQMISALIQGGHFTALVNQIYEEIGKVAAEAMRLTQQALDSGDPKAVYKLLGESLMESFEQGNKSTTGLAQSFLVKAKKALDDENIAFEIPFSAPTINGAFISDVVASINKKGIRRKYSGIASVLVPSYSMIQYYNYNGKKMMFNEFAKNIIKDFPRVVNTDETNEEKIANNRRHVLSLLRDPRYAIEHGAVKSYNVGEKPDMGDTVLIQDIDDEGHIVYEIAILNSYDEYDRVRNLISKGVIIYNWFIKPKDLRQSDTKFKIAPIIDLSKPKVIWAHPGIGKTEARKDIQHFGNVILDFDTDYKDVYLTQTLGIDPNSEEAKAFKKTEEWKNIRRELYRQAILDAKNSNKTLFVSDLFLLRENSNNFDQIWTVSQNTFLQRSYQRGEYDNDNLLDWKSGIDAALSLIDPNKIKITDRYLSDLLIPQEYSIYDLDSVRALHYIRQALETKENTGVASLGEYYDQKIEVIKNALLSIGVNWNGTFQFANFESWQRLLQAKVKKDLSDIDNGRIQVQTCFAKEINSTIDTSNIDFTQSVKISDVNVRHAEMIMGRLHASELGLRQGDDISTIKAQKDEFFKLRIKEHQVIAKAKNVYDFAVTTSTGHVMYVAIKDKHPKKDLAPYRFANKSFSQESTGIWYNKTEKISDFISDNCKIVSIQNDNKELCPLVIVDNEEDAEKFLNGEGIDFTYFNVNSNNFKYIVQKTLGKELEKGPIVLIAANRRNPEPFVLTKEILDQFDDLSDELKEKYCIKVKEYLDKQNDKKVDRLAHQQWLAFQQQLLYVGARIPTQSMQSFQALELIGFSDSDKNEVYVPRVQTWLQGSDYDIDKLYILSYNLAKNGVLPTFSALQYEQQLKDLTSVLRLKSPNGKEYSELNIDFSILEDGTYNNLLDNVSIIKTNNLYKIALKENEDSYITLSVESIDQNTNIPKVFKVVDVHCGSISEGIKFIREFSDLVSGYPVFISDGTDTSNALVSGLLRSDNYRVVDDGVTKVLNSAQKQYSDSKNVAFITKDEVHKVNGFMAFDALNKIMSSNSNYIKFADDVTLEEKLEFLRILNKHTTHTNNPNKERALQNAVVAGILNLLEKTTIQPYGHNPISIDDLKDLVTDNLDDLRMSMDNPITKFMMQVQNMVGKEVIGISAVTLKVFFAASTYMNGELDKAVDSYKDCDDIEFARHLTNILFVDRSKGIPELNTMANLNLKPLENLIKDGNDIFLDIKYLDSKTYKRLLPALGKIKKGNKLSLKAILDVVSKNSQSQDAAQNISELLSAATDNAKELILAKINATSEFADFWGALLMTGHSFKECDSIMRSPFLNTVAKMSKGFTMSGIHRKITSKNVFKFMTLDGNLPSINSKSLRIVLSRFPSKGLNQCFYYKLLYETDQNGNLLTYKDGKKVPINGKSEVKDLIKRSEPIYFYRKDSEKNTLDRVIIDEDYIKSIETNKDIKKRDIKFWLTSNKAVEIFINHLKSITPDISFSRAVQNDFDEDYDESLEDSMEFYSDEIQDDEDGEFIDDESYDIEVPEQDLRNLLRYSQKFLSERANILEENFDKFIPFDTIVNKVMPITEELSICGMELGVNQGIPTNEFDFYNKLMRIENFINKAYLDNDLKNDFDIIKFIEDKNYRETHIDKYESIKFALNPLAVISKVPNFEQMFSFYGTANKLLGRSAQFKLDMLLAKKVLKDNNTKRLNVKEFKAVHDGVKDSLILAWLKQKQISIKLPAGQLIYLRRDKNKIDEFYTHVEGTPLNLTTSENLATFKRLMDDYVFPKLKQKYPNNDFVRIIDSTTKENKTHEQLVTRRRMPIDMMSIDDVNQTDFINGIMRSFGEIAGDVEFLSEIGISDGNIKLGDLIYLYNLYVYKDSFNQDGFTRLFEIMTAYDNDSLVNDYYKYLSDIDRGLSLVDGLTHSVDEKYTTDGKEFEIKLNNLYYRLSQLANSDTRIGVSAVYNQGLSQIQFTDAYGNPVGKPITVRCKNASDFLLELPFSTGDITTDEDLREMGLDDLDKVKQRFRPNSEQVWNATMDAIDDVCGLNSDQYEMVDDELLADKENSPIKDLDPSMLIRVNRSYGFIYKGKIYINSSRQNYNANTKLHEMSHGVCALMKFSNDPNERHLYYKLIQDIYSSYSKEDLIEKAKNLGFKNIYSSDFKEELLVDAIATAFKSGIDSTVFKNQEKFSMNVLRKLILNATNKMLGINIKLEDRINLGVIGNTDLTSLVAMFGEKFVLDRDEKQNMARLLEQSAEAKAFKQHLFKNSESEYNQSKEGIYYTC